MATTHQPAPTQVGFGHHHEWLWVALGAVVVAIIAGSISWIVMRDQPTVMDSTLPISGFEYDHEVTAIHMPMTGVTGMYFGNSGALDAVIAPVSGFDLDHDTTALHMPSTAVTGSYFGNSEEVDPDK
jgi:hypothetical protein